MNMNFNLGKRSTSGNSNTGIKTDTEEKKPSTSSSTSSSSSKLDEKIAMRKKLVKFMAVVMGITIVLIVLVVVLTMNRKYTYDDIEQILTEAAQNYFADNKNQLPTAEDQIVEVDSANLVAGEYMKDLSEYTEEGTVCQGSVQVEKSGKDYLYSPLLNCGEKYMTKQLYQAVATKKNIVDKGYGLYSLNGSYVYRGENVNNYIKLDKALWRIVKITADNNMVLVKDSAAGDLVPWDDRYNNETVYASGINAYSASRVKDTLQALYNGPADKEQVFLSSNDKKKLISFNLCIGKRQPTEEGKENTTECSSVIQKQKIGLLTVSDYMLASVDENCKTASSLSCQNYNYLSNGNPFWLATASTTATNEVYSVTDDGNIEITNTCSYEEVRPVIYLNNKVLYKAGKGTKSNPYTIK